MRGLGAEMVQKMVWTGKWWEYRGDSMQGEPVAWWDARSGRLRLQFEGTTLDLAEHKRLFVRLGPTDIEKMVVASGYTRIPLPLDADTGVIRQVRAGIVSSVRVQGVTGRPVLAPFGGTVRAVGLSYKGEMYPGLGLKLTAPEGTFLSFKMFYEGDLPRVVGAGQTMAIVGDRTLPYDGNYASVSVLSFCLNDRETALSTLLTDDLGRIVMVRGSE